MEDIFQAIKDAFTSISNTQKSFGLVATIVGAFLGKEFFDFIFRKWEKDAAVKKVVSSILSALSLIIILATITFFDILSSHIDFVLYSLFTLFLAYLLYRNRKLNLKIKNNQQQYGQTSSPSPVFKRFEAVFSKKELTYGFVQYRPFFWKDDVTPKGIGYNLLEKIFYNKVKLKQHKYNKGKDGGNWDDIFSDLVQKKFDIIITPLFETRTRIHKFNVTYCSPLFYSNIGIYVRKNDFSNERLSFEEAITFLQDKIKKSSWKPEILKGELSELLILKHFKDVSLGVTENIEITPAGDEDFVKVLQDVNSDNISSGQFAFMEVFKANSIINKLKSAGENLELVNILKDNQLLYPVSFVVRKEDTVLRNLINIRLLEMRNTLDDKGVSELENAIKEIATSSDVQISENDFENIFIQKYDFTKIINNQ